ncbi:MAG: hypothetical protein Q4F05_19535 [bacterium]|nr:hypothetical protein [bacterium]
MKDIYDLLNDVSIDLDEYEPVELTKKEKADILHTVLSQTEKHKTRKASNQEQIVSIPHKPSAVKMFGLVAAAAVLMIAGINYKHVSNGINGLLPREWKKETASQGVDMKDTSNVQVSLVDTSRQDNKVSVKVRFKLITPIKNYVETMRDQELAYTNFKNYQNFTDNGMENELLGFEEYAFAKTTITVNEESVTKNKIMTLDNIKTECLSAYTIEKTYVFLLNNKFYCDDLVMKFSFENMRVDEGMIKEQVVVENTFKEAGFHKEDMKFVPLDIKASDSVGQSVDIVGYQYLGNCIRFFGKQNAYKEKGKEQELTVVAVDNNKNNYHVAKAGTFEGYDVYEENNDGLLQVKNLRFKLVEQIITQEEGKPCDMIIGTPKDLTNFYKIEF